MHRDRGRYGGDVENKWPYKALISTIALAVLLIPLACHEAIPPDLAYQQAIELFLHGKLAASEELAARSVERFRVSHAEWLAKFEVLEAEAAAWRGKNQTAIEILSKFSPADSKESRDSETLIRALSIKGLAHAHLEQFQDAEKELAGAQALCSSTNAANCGTLLRARAGLAMVRGEYPEAHRLYGESLSFARLHQQRWDESIALMNLGVACLYEEKFDEAIDWSRASLPIAKELSAEDVIANVMGNLGWAFFSLGDSERALSMYKDAEKRSLALGDTDDAIVWLTTSSYVYEDLHDLEQAASSLNRALALARQIKSNEDITNASMDLAEVYIEMGKLDDASLYASQSQLMAVKSGNHLDSLNSQLIQGQIASLRHDWGHALAFLREVETAPESQTSMKWASERAMAQLYEALGKNEEAQREYETALATFEGARAELKNADSQLPFIANAARIYDDYIHFLVQQGKVEEALLEADQSRARTLAQGLGQGLGVPAKGQGTAISPRAVARKANATLLFYWLGEKQSYLWAITPEKTAIFPLPAKAEIAARVERYRRALQGPEDPIEAGNADGAALYAMLVGPAAGVMAGHAPVMVLADGQLCQLNFETLIAPANAEHAAPHYWIEDATVVSAPSLAMLAMAKPAAKGRGKLLLVGDPVSPDASYPQLAYAGAEMEQVEKHFPEMERAVFARERATPPMYLASHPKEYAYIHFVSHGVASQTDPLDSAIILSRANGGEDSFKLYAREIMQHPIDARLVTISACYGSGTRAYVGEGLVGLSWAFLHAGAHNAIGALWEASDRSTAQLMDRMYAGLEAGESPGAALRAAKLELLHSKSSFRKPFYWAPFQMYTRL